MTSMAMNKRPGDERSGVERLRSRERRRWMIVGGLVLLIVADFGFMWVTGALPRDITHLPPNLANGMASGMLTGAAICFFRFRCKLSDEHDARARMFGAQVAFGVFVLAYPVWALFAIGRWLPPVNDFALWLGAALLYLAAFLWRKYR